jgi:hypothetical protein
LLVAEQPGEIDRTLDNVVPLESCANSVMHLPSPLAGEGVAEGDG